MAAEWRRGTIPIVTSDGAPPMRTTCASDVTNTPPSVGFPGAVLFLGGDCTELEELRDKNGQTGQHPTDAQGHAEVERRWRGHVHDQRRRPRDPEGLRGRRRGPRGLPGTPRHHAAPGEPHDARTL